MTIATKKDGNSRSVRRAISILEMMMERGEPVVMTDIIGGLRIPKSTAYDLVGTLSEAGFVAPAGKNGGLSLGRKLYELGMAYRSQVDLLRDGAPVVEALRDATGETVQLSVLDDEMMLVLMKEEGIKPLRIISQIGSRVPINWAASGRLLVSDLDDAALRGLLKRTVRPSPSGRAKTDPATIVAEVRRFRKRGYGIEVNEANDDAGCVAAPVIDSSGRCIAAISVVAPATRMTRSNREHLIAAVRQAAGRLSHRLGG